MLKNYIKTNEVLLLILIILNIADFLSTYILLSTGSGVEANPLMLYIISFFNTTWAIFYVKSFIVLTLIPFYLISVHRPEIILSDSRKGFSLFCMYSMLFLNVWYVYIVAHNISIIHAVLLS